jgi:hypothetical protein
MTLLGNENREMDGVLVWLKPPMIGTMIGTRMGAKMIGTRIETTMGIS